MTRNGRRYSSGIGLTSSCKATRREDGAMEDPRVRAFFEQYASGRSTQNVEAIASQYADPFMVADPHGPRAVSKPTVVTFFPVVLERLKTLGHTSAEVQSLESTDLDENYGLVRVQLVWCFERAETGRIEVPVDSTFILCVKDQVFTIVLQHEREDFRDALRAYGIGLVF